MCPVSVLLVDDSPIFLRIATRFLRESYSDEVDIVGVAHSGEEALARAQELQPQVILLDLSMPDMSGLEAIPLLHEVLPEASIIVLTLRDIDSYRAAALAAGADAFVSKADISTDLVPAIRRVVEAGGS